MFVEKILEKVVRGSSLGWHRTGFLNILKNKKNKRT